MGYDRWRKTSVSVSPYETGKYAILIDNLTPSTSYDVNIYFSRSGIKGSPLNLKPMTKSLYNNSYPYIYFNTVERNEDGSFPSGCALPLRMFNATTAANITWYFNNSVVTVDESCYYHPTKSGNLIGYINWEDGTTDTILKVVTIK